MKNLFVYGTLMSDMSRSGCLDTVACSRIPATISGVDLYFYGRGRYPAMVKNPSSTRVYLGELISVEDSVFSKLLPTLDLIEGYLPTDKDNSLFVRDIVEVSTAEGATQATAYLWNLPTNIESFTLISCSGFREFMSLSCPNNYNL